MSYTFHRAWIAALATGAMAASGVAFGAPALAATPAPDADGPMISDLATTSEGIGGQVTFSVVDNPGLSSIDLRDPASDAIFYRRDEHWRHAHAGKCQHDEGQLVRRRH